MSPNAGFAKWLADVVLPAAAAFWDPLSLTIDDPDHSTGKNRHILLGLTLSRKLVVVVHFALAERGRLS